MSDQSRRPEAADGGPRPGAPRRPAAGQAPAPGACRRQPPDEASCPACGDELHLWANYHRCRNCGYKESCCF
ncbi:MAG TPA: hypothetical protein PKD53_03560 [Chloroflexaceae bacterium]|nr:hypothetical protein [Chloroflexaceae bacterium]